MAVEALVRFPGPILSNYPVEYVVSLARNIGLIAELGIRIFRGACTQMARWKDEGLLDVRICINTCADELVNPLYLESLDEILEESGLLASDVELELTEREAIQVEKDGRGILAALKERGYMLTLDDFGTGYSSLSYLRTLPVDTLKLDKSFLTDVPHLSNANAIAEAVVLLATVLKIDVLAEGVEELAQGDFLRRWDAALCKDICSHKQ